MPAKKGVDNIKTMQERRQILTDLVRTREIRTKQEMIDILCDEFDHCVTMMTILRDCTELGISKDLRDNVYVVLDNRITRLDFFDEIKHILRKLVYKFELQNNFIALHTEFGVSPRLAGILEALRYDEEVAGIKRSFKDEIVGVLDGGITDTVMVFFKNKDAAVRFNKKLRVLTGEEKQWRDWVQSPEESELLATLASGENN